MRDLLDRLTPGHVLLAGLALLVLGVMAIVVSASASEALLAAAGAVWLAASAQFLRGWSGPRGEPVRLVAVGIPAVLALAFAAVAAGSAAQAVGPPPGSTRSGAPQEQVAGATGAGPAAPSTDRPSGTAHPAATGPSAIPSGASGGSASSPASAPTSSTPAPTPPASVALRHGRVTLRFTGLTSPVQRGSTATATVRATPGARCSIRVGHLATAATAAADLTPQVAPASGVVTWTWTVDVGAPRGYWPVKVTCVSLDSSAWWTRSLRVE